MYVFTFRYLTYKAIKNHFFMLDFCYFLNASVLLQSLSCSMTADSGFCSTWFKSNFMLSHGPIAVAILAWQNSIVFHSLDKMTSFFIHIMPVKNLIFHSISEVFSWKITFRKGQIEVLSRKIYNP